MHRRRRLNLRPRLFRRLRRKARRWRPPSSLLRRLRIVGYSPYSPAQLKPPSDRLGSVYIPVDSWMYSGFTRLYSMGFLDTMLPGDAALHPTKCAAYADGV